MVMAARIAITTITMSNSTMVKPLLVCDIHLVYSAKGKLQLAEYYLGSGHRNHTNAHAAINERIALRRYG